MKRPAYKQNPKSPRKHNLTGVGSESREQQELFTWWRMAHKYLGFEECQLFAIPNGGKRNVATAARMKREGVMPGIPDIFLAIPSKGFSGLFIELKRLPTVRGAKGKLSPKQEAALQVFANCGYSTSVAFGWLQAKEAIERYLDIATHSLPANSQNFLYPEDDPCPL